MALTPDDVANKRFTPTRFKNGYDEEEVDSFLDEVEAELRRLLGENASLRTALGAAQSAARPSAEPARPAMADAASPTVVPVPPAPMTPPAAPTPPAPPMAPAGPAPEPARADPQEGALRLLVSAQQTAEQAIAQAKSEADELVATAKNQAAAIEQEAARQHAAAMVDFQRQRNALESAIEGLRSFEREYRARMKAYLEVQLNDLASRPTFSPASATTAAETSPARPVSLAEPAPTSQPQPATPTPHPLSEPVAAAPPGVTVPPLAPPADRSPFTTVSTPMVAPMPPSSVTGGDFASDVDAGSDLPSGPPSEAPQAGEGSVDVDGDTQPE